MKTHRPTSKTRPSSLLTPALREWILATTRAGHGIPDVLRLLKDAGYAPAQSRDALAEVLKIPLSALNASTTKRSGERTRHPTGPRVTIDGRAIEVTLAVAAPALSVLRDLLSADECEELIALARPRLQRALTVDVDGGQQVDHRRTSAGMFFQLAELPLIQRIEQRLAQLLGVPAEHGEGLQVLHYLPGQAYESHFDWFDPSQPGFEAITSRGGQRIASVVMYLNTPEQGGGTDFPSVGLTVTALRGSAVYFAYETGDQSSLHAGLPVTRGEKWIATKWLRERSFR